MGQRIRRLRFVIIFFVLCLRCIFVVYVGGGVIFPSYSNLFICDLCVCFFFGAGAFFRVVHCLGERERKRRVLGIVLVGGT